MSLVALAAAAPPSPPSSSSGNVASAASTPPPSSSSSCSSSSSSSSSSIQSDEFAMASTRQLSDTTESIDSDLDSIEEEEEVGGEIEDEEEDGGGTSNLGPIISLKQHLELDKEDESLRRWKEQLLGLDKNLLLDMDGVAAGEMEPAVKVLTLGIEAEGRPHLKLSLPFASKSHAFTLKEGSSYRLCFTFVVSHNIVSGLTYVNTVWKNGLRVDHTRTMLGTFGPRAEPYTHFTDEETTPCGILARGSYSAKTKFLDDDKRCYLELDYTFNIRKDWH
ncbi:rho GDP-dissociation inhibitor 1 [Selaginella moellendorffii]|nr:rho GDP-dissociation inhibitor 1 [Selaginella moellendorffii]XP_024515867.1 rho GDP-dissociation inhibitor 1 [Selaginella moellendorffii]|eukprot:XP_002962694.2 rho GDP-dissociation inhibitor 1 [Selaginella moellendorffii]